MPKITVPGTAIFEVEEGVKLVLALKNNGVNILHRCGGKAKCTTCRVEILDGDFCEPDQIEKHACREKGVEDYLRLSCQVYVNADMTVRPILTVETSGMDAGPRPVE